MTHSMTGKVRAANDVRKELKGLVMMKKLASSFLLLVVAGCMLLTGCGQSSLREAEALLETDLKAADSILTSMPMPKSRRDRAWYVVLKTQADYKQYKTISSDSLILTATNYYGIHHKNYHAAFAWYTQGCVYNELHDDLSAIESFLNAKDLFPDTLLRYYALTEQRIGDVLLKRDMLKEASDMFNRTKAVSEFLNDSSLIVYSDFKQSLISLQNNDFENADVLFKELLRSPYISSFNKLEIFLGLAQVATFYEKDYYKSNTLTEKCIASKSHRAAGYNQRGINFLFLNKIDSAITCFKESMVSQKDIYTEYSIYSGLAESYVRFNEPDSALHYFTLCDLAVDSIGTILNHEELSSLLLSHSNRKNRADMVRMRYIVYSSIGIALIILLLLLYIYSTFKHREKERIMKRQQELQKEGEAIRKSTIELLESKIKDYSTQDPEARAVLLKSYSNRLQMCTNAFRATPEYTMLSSYRLSVKELNRNDRDELFNQIKRSYLESITDIRIEIPDIGEKDILTVILRNQGLSIEQISSLFSITTDSVKKRLYRLSQRASSDFLNIYCV